MGDLISEIKNHRTVKGIPLVIAKPKDKEDIGFKAQGGFDTVFLILVCVLVTIGLIMMFSASYYKALVEYNDSLYFLKRQAAFAAVGIAAMLFVSKINYNVFRKLTPIVVGISIVLLILVLLFPDVDPEKPNIKRWIMVPVIHQRFQPSEVAKLGLIMLLAWGFELFKKVLEVYSKETTIGFFLIVLLFAGLVFAEDHLSGAVLMAGIGFIMCFLGGTNWKIYAIGMAIGLVAIIIVVIKPDILKEYMGERIKAWAVKDYLDTDARWQTNNSLFALGSGGFFGLGLGNSKQKFSYLPEPHNDFIFAIVGEELGFLGCVIILVLFALLVWRGFAIALKARSTFGRLLTMGISTQIGLQTVLNIMVVTDLLPNTGISLPFFSYGGTSLLMLLGEMGMILSVSRNSRIKKLDTVKPENKNPEKA